MNAEGLLLLDKRERPLCTTLRSWNTVVWEAVFVIFHPWCPKEPAPFCSCSLPWLWWLCLPGCLVCPTGSPLGLDLCSLLFGFRGTPPRAPAEGLLQLRPQPLKGTAGRVCCTLASVKCFWPWFCCPRKNLMLNPVWEATSFHYVIQIGDGCFSSLPNAQNPGGVLAFLKVDSWPF